MTSIEYHEMAQKYDLRLETGSDGNRFYWLPGPISSKQAQEIKKIVLEHRDSGINYGLARGGDNQFHLSVTAPPNWY